MVAVQNQIYRDTLHIPANIFVEMFQLWQSSVQ